jgi:hypothetical protein
MTVNRNRRLHKEEETWIASLNFMLMNSLLWNMSIKIVEFRRVHDGIMSLSGLLGKINVKNLRWNNSEGET